MERYCQTDKMMNESCVVWDKSPIRLIRVNSSPPELKLALGYAVLTLNYAMDKTLVCEHSNERY